MRPSFPPRCSSQPSPAPRDDLADAASSRPMARQPWKLTSLLYPLLIAALLPLSLRDALARLSALTERLEPSPDEIAQLQIPEFRASLRERPRCARS